MANLRQKTLHFWRGFSTQTIIMLCPCAHAFRWVRYPGDFLQQFLLWNIYSILPLLQSKLDFYKSHLHAAEKSTYVNWHAVWILKPHHVNLCGEYTADFIQILKGKSKSTQNLQFLLILLWERCRFAAKSTTAYFFPKIHSKASFPWQISVKSLCFFLLGFWAETAWK